jgi:hypothetical protein
LANFTLPPRLHDLMQLSAADKVKGTLRSGLCLS